MHISIWEQESFFARKDVIIIGGGLAGLWCAYELLIKHSSLSLLILDRGVIPEGASTRNAGFACFGSPSELLHDAEQMGKEKMLQIAEARYHGIQKIRRVLGDKAIAYDDCGGYECLQKDNSCSKEFLEKISWLNTTLQDVTGAKATFSNASEKLTGFGFRGFDILIENKLEGGLHSGKLVKALQEKVRGLGGEIMQGIQIKNCMDNGDDVKVYTQQDITFSTSQVINCTNASIAGGRVTPARGQILVTRPVPHLSFRGTFHFDEGYYYFRNIGNRVLLGGARNKAFDEERTDSFGITQTVQAELERFLSTHILPDISHQIEYRWSGIMGFTAEKQPSINTLSPRIREVCICNGMGVALSPIIAEQIEL